MRIAIGPAGKGSASVPAVCREPRVLGVYMDLDYRRDGSTVSTAHAVIHVLTGLGERTAELTLLGRLERSRTGRR